MKKHPHPKVNKNTYIILLLLAIIATVLIYLSRKNVKEEFESLSETDKADAIIRSDLDNYYEEEICPNDIDWDNKIEVVQFQDNPLEGSINANTTSIKLTKTLIQGQSDATNDSNVNIPSARV
jgi:hypothetical protein